MALPEFVKLEDVPEQFRELYELKDGKAVPLAVEPPEDTGRLKGALDKERAHLKARGRSVAEFKRTAAYRLPLKHGTGPDWLKDM